MKINDLTSARVISNNNRLQSNSQQYETLQINKISNQPPKWEQLQSTDLPNVADPNTNSINIKEGEMKNIGTVDGIPLNIFFDSYGINTNFSTAIHRDDPVNSDRNRFAFLLLDKYTTAQRAKADSLSGRFQMLYSVAKGDISAKQYNETDLGRGVVSTAEFLTSLGIDVLKPFSFNNKSFVLDSKGSLHALLPSSQLSLQ
ncbi:hypothetical protein Desde_2635 [Desulfitobacterium dehalogenans ATCC 51507]|uniref:Uncharacterized protein n=1 Tax=Desulfitobacterium dehalogenans (strain ATCC 51507 / DSM 9161 / JW/IU-DC1) TaxID=756499 RepID=I4AAH0_DESDJ|nr:hypothetical protein [Desulfitobacterium dehalogenans]AFM00955.1 hypothetical protein Desde_2635 [Desulfitobacterium dehalogenans ATCC 51507]